MLKQTIKSALNALGYDLTRVPRRKIHIPQSTSCTDRSGAPLRIEFLGPSGIGKTTLSEELVRRRRKSDRWVLARELAVGGQNMTVSRDVELDEHYASLLELTIQSVAAKPIPVATKYWLLSFLHHNLMIDWHLSRFGGCDPIVVEDGILHNFSPAIRALAERHDNDNLDVLLRNRAVVYCYGSTDLLVERIEKRSREGRSRPQHEEKSSRELCEQSSRVISGTANVLALLRNYGLPCIELDMADALHENAERIRTFIQEVADTP